MMAAGCLVLCNKLGKGCPCGRYVLGCGRVIISVTMVTKINVS